MLRTKATAMLIGCSLLVAGCATSRHVEGEKAAPASSTTQYLVGEATSTSPDGSTPYGPPVAVRATRQIDADGGEIVEDSWHGAEHHRSLFKQRPDTLVFDVRDEGDSFKGTITFGSADLSKASVTYAIEMTDGSGSLHGTGSWNGNTYSTNKMFSDPTGTPRARIRETLTLVTKGAFDRMASPE
jgi:hypothetical protein